VFARLVAVGSDNVIWIESSNFRWRFPRHANISASDSLLALVA
jgi:hypothetical protein